MENTRDESNVKAIDSKGAVLLDPLACRVVGNITGSFAWNVYHRKGARALHPVAAARFY